MPSSEAVIWTAISGLIILLITIIGFLLKYGLDGIKGEIRGLRDDIKKSDGDKEALKLEQERQKTRCIIIHGIEPQPCRCLEVPHGN